MGNYFFLQVFTVIFALSIATTIFNKRILGFPQAIGVPIVSAIFVFILQWGASLLSGNQFITINIHNIEEAVRHIDFYDFLINGVICFILTSSALKFKVSDLRSYWKPISILASIALVLCAVFFGVVLYGYQFIIGQHVDLLVLLLLGAALGATDPIGIKGVLSSVRAPHHLMVKLEGESLFNDAMCIALFMTLLNVLQGENFTVMGVLQTLLYEIFVAVIIGWAFGLGVLRLLRGKHEMESLILTTALLACGSYLVALFAHASAPIACVIGGLIVGNKWKEILQEREIREVNHFWHTVEGIINSFLFTLIGLELFILDLSFSLIFGGKITVVQVLALDPYIAAEYISATQTNDLIERALTSVLKTLEEAAAKFSDLGIPVEAKLLEGQVVHREIIREAETSKADLIVIGSHGRTGLKRLFLGSVAQSVLGEAHIPVLVVRQ